MKDEQLNEHREKWRKTRNDWLKNPENRERDRKQAKERYHRRKLRVKKYVQQQLPL
jgi:hypothetical protein